MEIRTILKNVAGVACNVLNWETKFVNEIRNIDAQKIENTYISSDKNIVKIMYNAYAQIKWMQFVRLDNK